MAETLGYASPHESRQSPKRSICAALGFVVSLTWPFTGCALTALVARVPLANPSDNALGWLLLFGPGVTGLVLSIIAIVQIIRAEGELLGTGQAVAGLLIALGWGFALIAALSH